MKTRTILRRTVVALLAVLLLSSGLTLQAFAADKLGWVGPVYKELSASLNQGFKAYYKKTYGKDVDITVRDGLLTIKAERTEKKESEGRSEFSYGSFARSVTLPRGADEDAITASYDKGILTVSVPVAADKAAEKHVEVKS